MILRGERVVLRPLTAADVTPLAAIAAEPSVRRWWSDVDLDEKLRGVPGATYFTVELDGAVIGLAQCYEEDDPMYRSAGIDLFLGTAWQGRGLGADTVRTLARWLVSERGHHRLTIDPAAGNEAAIRCYAKVGFRRIGIARAYWRDGDGVLHDGLLMDLLAEELA